MHEVGSFLLWRWVLSGNAVAAEYIFEHLTARVFCREAGFVCFLPQKKGSHFMNELEGWWITVALSFPHSPFFYFHIWSLVSSLPCCPTAPSAFSCCCNFVVVYHWMSDANLCFALALCPLLVVFHLLFAPSPLSLHLCLRVQPVTTYFTSLFFFFFVKFILTSPISIPPLPCFFCCCFF